MKVYDMVGILTNNVFSVRIPYISMGIRGFALTSALLQEDNYQV